MAAATGEYWIPAGCKVVISLHIGLVMSLESSSIPSGAWQCWARQPSVWPSIGEYCIGWLLRQRNYWKLIWAVKAIIWGLRNNWPTGENPSGGGWRCQLSLLHLLTWNDHLQQTVCPRNEMQLDGSFIPSQSSELIEKGFSNECIWFHSSYLFLPNNRTICMFFSSLMIF